jgi:ubiquinone/menaquinone biosynthesis C-methylase UbiE
MKIDYCILRLRNFLGIPLNPKTALTKLPLSEGQTVLDFGCGIGSFTLPAAQKVGPKGKVFALYKENTAPSEIRKAAQRKNLKNIKTIQSDAATHLPDNSVDPVLFIEVLPFVNDARTNPKGIDRALKPNGLFATRHCFRISKEEMLRVIQGSNLFLI